MPDNDVEYWNRRAQQHRDRSAVCGDPATRRLHEQFAQSYASRATQLSERQTG